MSRVVGISALPLTEVSTFRRPSVSLSEQIGFKKRSMLFVMVRLLALWVIATLNISQYTSDGIGARRAYTITYPSANEAMSSDCSPAIGHVLIKDRAENIQHCQGTLNESEPREHAHMSGVRRLSATTTADTMFRYCCKQAFSVDHGQTSGNWDRPRPRGPPRR